MKDVDTTVAQTEATEKVVETKTEVKKDPNKKKETFKKVRDFLIGFVSGVAVGGTAAAIVVKTLNNKK